MFRSARIEGSATPIIDTSRASRKSAPQSMSSMPQASLVNLSVSPTGGGAAVVLVKVDMQASLLRGSIYLQVQAPYRLVVAYASTFEIQRLRSSPAARDSGAAERRHTGGLGLVPAGTRHPHAPPRGRPRAGDRIGVGGLRRARSAGARRGRATRDRPRDPRACLPAPPHPAAAPAARARPSPR